MSGRFNLKFRTWDTQNKKFLSWNDTWYSVCFLPKGSTEKQEEDIYVPFFSVAIQAPSTKYIISQFTGTYDKNGVEVYDEDILKDLSNRVYRVKWQAPSFCLVCKYANADGTEKSYLVNNARMQTEMTVIGNMYEHPQMYNIVT